jgi:hypothetical protein
MIGARSKRSSARATAPVFVGALVTLTWRLAELGTWLNSLALFVMVPSAIKTFFRLYTCEVSPLAFRQWIYQPR